MKTIIALTSMVLLAGSVQAGEIKFINKDNSALGELCIAAVKTDDSIAFLAKELGIPQVAVKDIECNDKSIQRFVRDFRNDAAQPMYVFSVNTQTPETQLCLAALTSQEDYIELKKELLSVALQEDDIQCNGMPVKQFARKYRDRIAKIQGKTTAAL